MRDESLRLGSQICERGRYQYRVNGPRPGTSARDHRVPGGKFDTPEEALAYAHAFLAKEDPWADFPFKLTSGRSKTRKRDENTDWEVDSDVPGLVHKLRAFVTTSATAEQQVNMPFKKTPRPDSNRL